MGIYLYVLSHFNCVWFSATPWTVACQAPLSMGFSRQENWSGLPHPPGGLPYPGTEPGSPALQADCFSIWATREVHIWVFIILFFQLFGRSEKLKDWGEKKSKVQDIIHGILQFLFFQRTYHSSLTSEMQIIAKRQKKVITEVIYLGKGKKEWGSSSGQLPFHCISSVLFFKLFF